MHLYDAIEIEQEQTMPNEPPPPQKKRPRTHVEINEYRRNSLVAGALRSLAEYGVAGTTVSTICTAAGSSRGLLGHYFSNKDDVIVAAFQHVFGQLTGLVKESIEEVKGTSVEKLSALPSALFGKPVFTELNQTVFLALWHETRFNKQVRSANRQLYRDYIIRIQQMFTAAADEVGAQIDTHQAALGFIALSDGLWLGLSIHDDVMPSQQAVEICQKYILRELQLGQNGCGI
jgi:TetR/AcrR family transcriptional repressor of bet genes